MLMYLSDNVEGGETYFPMVSLSRFVFSSKVLFSVIKLTFVREKKLCCLTSFHVTVIELLFLDGHCLQSRANHLSGSCRLYNPMNLFILEDSY